jgi:hypothetical protein
LSDVTLRAALDRTASALSVARQTRRTERSKLVMVRKRRVEWRRESVRRSWGSGSINGMTSMKVAVSLPRETFERAKRAVGRGRAPSLSAYVAAALEQKATLDELKYLSK